MRMKSILGATLFAATMAVSSAASAITIDGITFDEGAVFKATRIFENVIVNEGDVLNGIGNVLSIENGSNVETWGTGDNGRELTFEFGGYVVESIEIIAGGTLALIKFSGGFANFYSDSTPDFSGSSGGGQAQDIINATDGNLWLTLVGAGTGTVCGGGAAGDPASGACFSGDGTVITLESTINITGSDLAAITSGSGFGFLDVAFGGGLADSFFDTNSQPSGQDVALLSNFQSGPPASSANWPLGGTADLALVAEVPEPGTLALLGIGLFGLGILARRGRKSA